MAKRLNEQIGSGVGSRLSASINTDLPSGWRIERQSAKSCVWFDDRGKQYKSSKQVEAALRERGLHGLPSETETETETASEYAPSPVKKPRTVSPPPGPRYYYRVEIIDTCYSMHQN